MHGALDSKNTYMYMYSEEASIFLIKEHPLLIVVLTSWPPQHLDVSPYPNSRLNTRQLCPDLGQLVE